MAVLKAVGCISIATDYRIQFPTIDLAKVLNHVLGAISVYFNKARDSHIFLAQYRTHPMMTDILEFSLQIPYSTKNLILQSWPGVDHQSQNPPRPRGRHLCTPFLHN